MVDTKVTTDQIQRTFAQTFTKWLIGFGVGIAGFSLIIVFWPQITAFTDTQRTIKDNKIGVEQNAAQLAERGPVIIGLQRTTEDNTAEMERIVKILSAIEEQENSLVNETRESITDMVSRLAVVEDNFGDLKGQVDRVETDTEANTVWRGEQQTRATERITKQEFRDRFIAELQEGFGEIKEEDLPEVEKQIALIWSAIESLSNQ